jgi:hypothetical protein
MAETAKPALVTPARRSPTATEVSGVSVPPRNTAAHVLARRPLKSASPVRRSLTRNGSRKRARDTVTKLRDLERQIGSYAVNANGEADTLPSFEHLHEVIEDAVRVVVHRALQDGYTWRQIGEALGMTRQSAWERWGP